VEFEVTFFGLSEELRDKLDDFCADQAYKFAERHGLDTPAIMSRGFKTEEYWDEVTNCEAHDACGGHRQ
jgi:hypothetical protein